VTSVHDVANPTVSNCRIIRTAGVDGENSPLMFNACYTQMICSLIQLLLFSCMVWDCAFYE